jgi:hypothetical protein
MRALSRAIFDTEAKFCDANIERAHQGAGFVAIRSLTQDQATRIAQIARPFSPVSMQWYRALVVESLV